MKGYWCADQGAESMDLQDLWEKTQCRYPDRCQFSHFHCLLSFCCCFVASFCLFLRPILFNLSHLVLVLFVCFFLSCCFCPSGPFIHLPLHIFQYCFTSYLTVNLIHLPPVICVWFPFLSVLRDYDCVFVLIQTVVVIEFMVVLSPGVFFSSCPVGQSSLYQSHPFQSYLFFCSK